MIDYLYLVANALWILGLTLALATISYTSWQASLSDEKLAAWLSQLGCQRWLLLSGAMICVGMALLSQSVKYTVIWAALGLLCLVSLVLSMNHRRSTLH